MSHHDNLVRFTGDAARLPEDEKARLRPELADVAQWLLSAPPLEVTASGLYSGYTERADRRVLGVEVRSRDRYETHIVKVGSAEAVARDADGWAACTQGRQVASRILAPVRRLDLPDGRVAVVYRDAYTLFGPDTLSRQPHSLEEVAGWAVFDSSPFPESLERAIAQVFTDLGLWFYPGAAPNAVAAAAFYRAQLRDALETWSTHDCHELRRDALWLLCGNDPPDLPAHDHPPPRYLDAVELVRWALDTAALPATLVGRSHGDLHARNVLLGVRRREAEYPAVFDYGAMRTDNVLAWDFAKLETELKVRLLPKLYREDAAARAYLLGQSKRRRRDPAEGQVSDAACRADRLEFAFRFEGLLAERTGWAQTKADAEALGRFGTPSGTGVDRLDRLLGLLLRVRKEAALWLGFESHRDRYLDWKDDLHFALAVYGLVNVRWCYDPPARECALVAAGVAAARLDGARRAITSQIAADRGDGAAYPSYRVPLALAHRRWLDNRPEEGRDLLQAVRAGLAHAVPLQAEYALLSLECGDDYRVVERLLGPYRHLCQEFGDHETLCRLGRAFKDAGDGRWDRGTRPGAALPAALQMYQQALTFYREAFAICVAHDARVSYYPGVNAATLALLTGQAQEARGFANAVLKQCAPLRDLPRLERFWIFASEGEAKVVLGDRAGALPYYESAVAELIDDEGGRARSAYQQLVRLRRLLGEEAVGPILDLFEARFPAVMRPLRPADRPGAGPPGAHA